MQFSKSHIRKNKPTLVQSKHQRRFCYMKTIFEQHGGTYTMQGDYHLPNLTVEETETRPIGVWGQRRLHYLKHHRKVLYYNLLTSGKLNSHLADTEEQAQELFARLSTDLVQKEGITEQLKSTDQMNWVQKMNNIRERVIESVYSNVVYI